jgi:ABC-2 type transport system permease protein
MRLAALYRKEMTEAFRDWKMLSLTLTFAPFFVFLMYGYLGHTSPVYQVAVVNADAGALTPAGEEYRGGEELMTVFRELRGPQDEEILRIREAEEEDVQALLQNRRADVIVRIPPEFSQTILGYQRGMFSQNLPIRSLGDPGNPDYLMAVAWVDMLTLEYIQSALGVQSPLTLEPETVTGVESLTDFDLYVPGLLVLALMMIMFTAAGALIREKDKGTIIRLRLSNLRVLEWLAAVSATQLIVGILALALTYVSAVAVGYRAVGSLWLLLLVGALASISVMAISVLVAAFLRTVFDLVTVGCFPFFILMFFSGGMFPLPGVPLFQLGEHGVELNEILPTTHAITALNKVLSYDAGLGGITYEIGAILILTAFYFALGTWIFTRRHMPAVG